MRQVRHRELVKAMASEVAPACGEKKFIAFRVYTYARAVSAKRKRIAGLVRIRWPAA